eukprot:351570-Chlamydomonas_euryale.AAC.5
MRSGAAGQTSRPRVALHSLPRLCETSPMQVSRQVLPLHIQACVDITLPREQGCKTLGRMPKRRPCSHAPMLLQTHAKAGSSSRSKPLPSSAGLARPADRGRRAAPVAALVRPSSRQLRGLSRGMVARDGSRQR